MPFIPLLKMEAQSTLLRAEAASGLLYCGTTSAADGVLEQFFAAYDSSFVLENEKESFLGFAQCLALNDEPRYQDLRSEYGPFREFVVVVRESSGAVVGGLNFIIFSLNDPDHGGPSLSLNLNYIFVPPSQRRRGVFKAMVADVPSLAVSLFNHTNANDIPEGWTVPGRSPSMYTFIEQNDPYRMSPEDYALDTHATGLDQLARIALWTRQGARIVDFPYVQPALTADQEADPNLVYAVLGARSSSLHPALLRQHLLVFFGISVLKGRDPQSDVDARRQLGQLAEMSAAGARVELLDATGLASLPNPSAANGTATLRGLLRRYSI
ncbi:MAG: hypothetical protein HC869_06470 [Rhodospirillales bacterium]|nr:hypothetical protein [Rhodospirillales bacterium]